MKLLLVFLSVFAISQGAWGNAKMFNSLKGNWAGQGFVKYGNMGQMMRCRASAKGKGVRLTISIRCASQDFSIKATTHLKRNGNKISGSWSETSLSNSRGGLYGSARGNKITLRVDSSQIKGNMTITNSRGRQQVSIKTRDFTFSAGLLRR